MKSLFTHYLHFIHSKITDSQAKKAGFSSSIAKKIRSYTLKTIIKKQNDAYSFASGFYLSSTKKTVFIKSTQFITKNSSYFNLKHEKEIIEALRLFLKPSKMTMPKVISSSETKSSYALIQEYIKGKELSDYSPQKQLAVIKECLDSFDKLSTEEAVTTLSETLPIRGSTYLFFSFFIFLGILLVRDMKRFLSYLKIALMFSYYYLSENIFESRIVFSHRDLHTNNILVRKNEYVLLDPEVAALTQPHTDIAILIRSIAYFPKLDLIRFLTSLLRTNADKKKFLSLSLYYAVQIAAMGGKQTLGYKEGMKYLHTYFPRIKRLLPLKHYSLATRTLQITLNVLSLLLRQTNKLKISDKVILCYHNVGTDNWNFTIHPESLMKQLTWLKETATISPLSNLTLRSKKPEVAVTFDDGYKSMITHALPIVSKLGINPTLFILGNPTRANRTELDNNNPLLSYTEVKQLKKAGWEIGYHTNTHADLRKLTDRQLFYEVIESKNKVEKKLGFSITHFAYPRGIYDERVNNLMKKSPYTHAYTVDGGALKNSSDKNHLQRICFEGEVELYQFQALVSKPGIVFYRLFMKILKLKEKHSQKIKSTLKYVQKKVMPYLSIQRLDLKLDLW